MPAVRQGDAGRRQKVVESFTCEEEYCGMEFGRKSDLGRHARTHQKEKSFKCDYPGCRFTCIQKGGLKTHMNIHSGDKPHPCIFCEWRFNDKSSLCRHMKSKHPGQYVPAPRKPKTKPKGKKYRPSPYPIGDLIPFTDVPDPHPSLNIPNGVKQTAKLPYKGLNLPNLIVSFQSDASLGRSSATQPLNTFNTVNQPPQSSSPSSFPLSDLQPSSTSLSSGEAFTNNNNTDHSVLQSTINVVSEWFESHSRTEYISPFSNTSSESPASLLLAESCTTYDSVDSYSTEVNQSTVSSPRTEYNSPLSNLSPKFPPASPSPAEYCATTTYDDVNENTDVVIQSTESSPRAVHNSHFSDTPPELPSTSSSPSAESCRSTNTEDGHSSQSQVASDEMYPPTGPAYHTQPIFPPPQQSLVPYSPTDGQHIPQAPLHATQDNPPIERPAFFCTPALSDTDFKAEKARGQLLIRRFSFVVKFIWGNPILSSTGAITIVENLLPPLVYA